MRQSAFSGSGPPVSGMTPGTNQLKYYKEYSSETFANAETECNNLGLRLASVYTAQEFADFMTISK